MSIKVELFGNCTIIIISLKLLAESPTVHSISGWLTGRVGVWMDEWTYVQSDPFRLQPAIQQRLSDNSIKELAEHYKQKTQTNCSVFVTFNYNWNLRIIWNFLEPFNLVCLLFSQSAAIQQEQWCWWRGWRGSSSSNSTIRSNHRRGHIGLLSATFSANKLSFVNDSQLTMILSDDTRMKEETDGSTAAASQPAVVVVVVVVPVDSGQRHESIKLSVHAVTSITSSSWVLW